MAVRPDGLVGFFNGNKAPDCNVLEPSLQATCDALVTLSRRRPQAFRCFHHFEARARDARGKAAVFGALRDGQRAPASSRAALAELDDVLVGIEGDPMPEQQLDLGFGVMARCPVDSFMQISSSVNRLLIAHVVAGAQARGVARFADLYCGVGNYALPLLAHGLSGLAVDVAASSVGALRRSAAQYAWPLATHVASMVAFACDERFELVVANPPRAGFKQAGPRIASLVDRHLVIASCNPTTLARDLVELRQRGFAITELTAFDMFPWTWHIETVVWLRRTAGG